MLETERDRSLDKQQRELIGEMPCLQSDLCNDVESRESDRALHDQLIDRWIGDCVPPIELYTVFIFKKSTGFASA